MSENPVLRVGEPGTFFRQVRDFEAETGAVVVGITFPERRTDEPDEQEPET